MHYEPSTGVTFVYKVKSVTNWRPRWDTVTKSEIGVGVEDCDPH